MIWVPKVHSYPSFKDDVSFQEFGVFTHKSILGIWGCSVVNSNLFKQEIVKTIINKLEYTQIHYILNIITPWFNIILIQGNLATHEVKRKKYTIRFIQNIHNNGG